MAIDIAKCPLGVKLPQIDKYEQYISQNWQPSWDFQPLVSTKPHFVACGWEAVAEVL